LLVPVNIKWTCDREDTGCRVPDAGYLMLVTGYWMADIYLFVLFLSSIKQPVSRIVF